jgi:hypothetical protein
VNPLRRISEALREMRWAQVVLELALLILGILIALAVDGWMDDRRDARSERQYLELLMRDLDRDLEVLDEFMAFEELQVADSILAYRALRSGSVATADREAVAAALMRLTSRRTLRLTRATYTDLLSTGNLRLIRTSALRDRIVGLYEANERMLVIRDRNNQVFVDEIYTQYLLNSGLVSPRPTHNLPVLSKPMLEFATRLAMPVGTANDRLWQVPADAPERAVLANKVLFRGYVSNSAITQSQIMAGEIREVRDAIAAELARRWPR